MSCPHGTSAIECKSKCVSITIGKRVYHVRCFNCDEASDLAKSLLVVDRCDNCAVAVSQSEFLKCIGCAKIACIRKCSKYWEIHANGEMCPLCKLPKSKDFQYLLAPQDSPLQASPNRIYGPKK